MRGYGNKIAGKNRPFPAGPLLICLLLAYAFLLSLGKVSDPDAWVHLNLGKLMVEHGGMPEKEPFVFPSMDMPVWPSYPFWLFGLVFYIAYAAAGAGGMVLLKASIVAAAFFTMFRDSLRPYGNHVVSSVVLVAAVMISQYRFIVRPDIFLMLFLSFSVFSLNAYVYDNRRHLYALPLVHLLWANSHSSISVMFVPFIAFLAGGLVQRYLGSRGRVLEGTPTAAQLRTIGAVFVASFAASLINPNFMEPYFFAFKVMNTAWYRQNIVELVPPAGGTRTLLIAAAATIAASFVLARRRFSLIHLMLVAPFIALPFTAARFQFLIAVAGAPVLARNLSAFLEHRGWGGWGGRGRRNAAAAAAAALIVAACALGLSGVHPFGVKGREFGLSFGYADMPVGAVQYMDKRKIYGRVFNTFHFGQYIIWKSYPKRTVFVDGRGYLPEEVLRTYQDAGFSREAMDELSGKYGFDSILLGLPYTGAGDKRAHSKVDMSFEHPDWALVYWDDVSFLYLKRGGKHSRTIEKDEYRYIKPLMPFSTFLRELGDGERRRNLMAELRRNLRQSGSSRAGMYLGLLYLGSGRYREAIASASGVRSPALRGSAYIVMADAYKALGELDNSIAYYKKSLALNRLPGVYHRVGAAYALKGDYRRALKYYEKALDMDGTLAYVYPGLIEAYRALGMTEEAERAEGIYYHGSPSQGR